MCLLLWSFSVIRPSIEDTMIAVAFTMAERSTCSRRHNGAVIATEHGVVLSTGYNGSLSGMPHCNHDCMCDSLPEPLPTDTIWVQNKEFHNLRCPVANSGGCETAVHAEANAVYFAARNGIRTDKSIIYCTTEPCQKCAEAIVQAGISQCVYSQEYRIHAGIELLRNAGVTIVKM